MGYPQIDSIARIHIVHIYIYILACDFVIFRWLTVIMIWIQMCVTHIWNQCNVIISYGKWAIGRDSISWKWYRTTYILTTSICDSNQAQCNGKSDRFKLPSISTRWTTFFVCSPILGCRRYRPDIVVFFSDVMNGGQSMDGACLLSERGWDDRRLCENSEHRVSTKSSEVRDMHHYRPELGIDLNECIGIIMRSNNILSSGLIRRVRNITTIQMLWFKLIQSYSYIVVDCIMQTMSMGFDCL